MAKYVMYKADQLELFLSSVGVSEDAIKYLIKEGGPHEADNDGIVSVSNKIRARDPEIRIKRKGDKHTLIVGTDDERAVSYEIDVKIPPRNSDAFRDGFKQSPER